MKVKIDNKVFIERAKEFHGDKYDYSLINYIGYHKKLKIFCKDHGVFEQTPAKHLIGCGCPKCSKNVKFSNEDFIFKSNLLHKNKYDYSLVDYKNAHTKVKIICKDHGIFEQQPRAHLAGNGCSSCVGNKKLNKIIFQKKSNKTHDNRYDYSLVEYENNNTKVKIICEDHGIFEQLPFNHMKGCGCPKCDNYSAGEKKIEKLLNKNNIIFEPQKEFEGCINVRSLHFDFFLPEKNLCIEFDGDQHFNRYRFEDNDDGLNIRKKRDQIKNIYCDKNNMKLIRIKFDENIENKLKEILNDN